MVRSFLNLITFNVRSLIEYGRRFELYNLINKFDVDIAFLQETHLRPGVRVSFEGCNFIRDNSAQGVAILLRQNYKYKIEDISDFCFPCIFISIDVSINGVPRKILLGSIYIPGNSSHTQINSSLTCLGNYSRGFDFTFVGGDFNAKHVSWGDSINNSNGTCFYDFLQQHPYMFTKISSTEPTFPNGSSFLDHFIVNSNSSDLPNPLYSTTSLPTFSDHYPLKLNIKLPSVEIFLHPPSFFVSHQNTNWSDFKHDVTQGVMTNYPNSVNNLTNGEIDQYIQHFTSVICTVSESHSEKVELGRRKFLISDRIKNLYKLKYSWQKELKRIYQLSSDRHSPQYRLLSKQIQLLGLMIKKQVELEQVSIFREKLRGIKPGPKAHRQVFKIIGHYKTPPLQKLSIDGVTLTNEAECLNRLRLFFSSIYNMPVHQPSEEELINGFIANLPQHSVSFSNDVDSRNREGCESLTTLDEVMAISAAIKNKKSSGLDGLSNFIIRKLPVKAFEYLTIIFNNCISNGYFPDSWKISKIIPIKKKANSEEISNLRPISLLSNLGKLFEIVIRKKMDNGISLPYIPNSQFGFQRGHSTVDAMTKFHNDIVLNLRDKKCTVAVFLDVEKAFDHASHYGILTKMINIGFNPQIIKLIKSFFTRRQFCVQFKHKLSELSDVNCGVPQGSVLAPHLYNIFMSDFPHDREHSKSILYADDSLLYSHHESPVVALADISQHLRVVNQYFDKWGIKINPSKCEAICIRNASGKCKRFVVPESKTLKLVLNGTEIPFKDSVTYLGIEFNKLFKFNVHARKVRNKAQKIFNSFLKLFCNKFLPSNTKILLYKTCIRPIISYAFPIWFNISPTIMKELEMLERKILRLCIGKNFSRRNKRYSNNYIYSKSKLKRFSNYAFDILDKFNLRLEFHENAHMIEAINSQRNFGLSNTQYLSPLGFSNEDQAGITCFYEKALAGTHRG